MTWKWPLPNVKPAVPEAPAPGAFGAVRKHDVHTGVDLYCDELELVTAVEPGLVYFVKHFTGARAGSPWWYPTMCVGVEGPSGVVVYGEVKPDVRPGDTVRAGDPIGTVQRVLKHDKGLPMSMLHLELYAHGTLDTVWWRLGEPQPKALLDPTPYLEALRKGGS